MSSWLQIFLPRPRFFLPYTDGDQHCEPVDPGVSWIGPTAFVVGLNPEVELPRFIQLHSHRRGRVFRWTTANQVVRVLAFFPSHPAHDRVPPCPGFSPEGFTSWAHPVTAFTDGSQGAWDFRIYPQLFDPCRPWRGFVPFLPKVGASSDNSGSNRLERWSVMDFWRWNDPCSSSSGGYWLSSRIHSAFDRRRAVENNVEQIYASCREHLSFNHYVLPCYDPLKLSDALQWRTFREGRDALSRMLIYIAELAAFSEWMPIEAKQAYARQQGQWPPASPPPPPSPSYMGVWAQTIQSTEEWNRLSYAGIPIYVAMEVMPNHSLFSIAMSGAPDADERYRHNAFDASLGRQSVRNVVKVWHLPETSIQYATTLTSPQILLPPSVFFPTQHESTNGSRSSPSAWYHSYTSYLYQDEALFRGFLSMSPSETKVRQYERQHLAVLHPTQRLLNSCLDPHPILAVLPEGRNRGTTHFLEQTDGCGNFWAERKSSKTDTRYQFYYERDRVVIHSSRPFPGRPRSIGRVPYPAVRFEDCDMPQTQGLPDNSPRHYYLKKTDVGKVQSLVVWNPEKDEKGFDIITDAKEGAALNRSTPYILPASKQLGCAIPPNSTRPPSILFDSYASKATTIADLMSQPIISASLDIPDDPKAIYEDTLGSDITSQLRFGKIQEISDLLREQENEVERQSARRFFLREWENWASDSIVQALIPGSNVVYYPIRICNWDGSIGYDELLGLLDKATGRFDIITMNLHYERDGTVTSDIGYRYCEDALGAWSVFRGLRVGEYVLEAIPLKAIPHLLYISASNFCDVRPKTERLDNLHRLLIREAHLGRDKDLKDWVISNCVFELLVQIDKDARREYGFGNDDEEHWPPLITALRLNGITRSSDFSQKCTAGNFERSDSNVRLLSEVHSGHIRLKDTRNLAQAEPIVEGNTSDLEEGEMKDGGIDMKAEKKRRRMLAKRARGARYQSGSVDQAQAQSMTSYERARLKRATLDRADRLATCWKGLKLKPFDRELIKTDTSIVSFYRHLWSWRDECLDALSVFRGMGAHQFDFSPFEVTFGDLEDLCKVYGREYRVLIRARSQYEAERSMRQ